MIVLLGSRAARAWFDDFRPAKDWDAVASLDTIRRWSQRNAARIRALVPTSPRKLRCILDDGCAIEWEVAGDAPAAWPSRDPPGSAALLLGMAATFRPCPFPGGEALAASPAALWLTKRSHACWPVHWRKTMEDLHWLRARAEPPTAAEQAYHDARLAEHRARLGARRIRLDVGNDAFFARSERAVGRVVEHDRLHEIVAYGARPLFEAFKHDLSRAALSRALFEAAPLADRLRLVREEAMVIALERVVLPRLPERADAAGAYAWALSRICTTLASGWFRDFAIDHWPAVREPDKDFVTPALSALPHK